MEENLITFGKILPNEFKSVETAFTQPVLKEQSKFQFIPGQM